MNLIMHAPSKVCFVTGDRCDISAAHMLCIYAFCQFPLQQDTQLAILREVWKVISQLKDPKDYVKCAEVYIELPAQNFTVRNHAR